MKNMHAWEFSYNLFFIIFNKNKENNKLFLKFYQQIEHTFELYFIFILLIFFIYFLFNPLAFIKVIVLVVDNVKYSSLKKKIKF